MHELLKKENALGIVLCVCVALICAATLIVTQAFCRQYTPRPAVTPSPVPTAAPTPVPTPAPTPTPEPIPTGENFDTFNTVIYGHNMADGTYFGSLKSYNDADFLAAHREIDIYTPTRLHRYDVIAVVCYDDRYITDRYDDTAEADRVAFLKSLQEFGAVIPADAEVSTDGHIITLSTCIGGMPNNRLLIVASERDGEE